MYFHINKIWMISELLSLLSRTRGVNLFDLLSMQFVDETFKIGSGELYIN
jgi:hypothetical protein